MKYLFLFGLFPENYKSEIERQSIGNIQYAANVLQWSIVKGFDHFCEVKLINLPYIGSYPSTYKKFYSKGFNFSHNVLKNTDDKNIGFINLKYVKHYFRYLETKKALSNELKKTDKNEIVNILIYALNSPFLKAAIDVKRKYKNVKICQITPDLPEFMSDKMNFAYKVFRIIDSNIIHKTINEIDSFVFLTDNMSKALNVENKPSVTVEGIFDPTLKIKTNKKREKKTILYTGTLEERYGILNLLEAFMLINDPEYKLWICGDGNTNEKIKFAAKKDKRICFFGLKPHAEILELQQIATVLVNPRTSEGEFTKYSFPSKTMEYLASGTPTIIYKLEGIPDEYFDHCFTIEEETIDALKKQIIEVCNLDEESRKEFGIKAQKFVLEYKNPIIQCEKIYNMLNKN